MHVLFWVTFVIEVSDTKGQLEKCLFMLLLISSGDMNIDMCTSATLNSDHISAYEQSKSSQIFYQFLLDPVLIRHISIASQILYL